MPSNIKNRGLYQKQQSICPIEKSRMPSKKFLKGKNVLKTELLVR